jgi:hypothetical protein
VEDREDEFLTKFGESKGKKMKEFVRSIAAMCMVLSTAGVSSTCSISIRSRGQIKSTTAALAQNNMLASDNQDILNQEFDVIKKDDTIFSNPDSSTV